MGLARHVVDFVDAKGAQLRGHRRRVIDHVMCAKLAHPLLCFRPRRGGNQSQAGQLACQLNQYRADAASATSNQ
ncbi:hypothetical protein A9R05_39095 (plasmid) [Burkholderia sp. KK1]|nr:hypothetical protein A9R05_39095 [Burkholderia sp. KK1]